MKATRVSGIVAGILLAATAASRGDIIVMKDGSIVEGRVTARDAKGLTVLPEGSKSPTPLVVAADNMARVVETDENGAETAEADGVAKPAKRADPHWNIPVEPTAPPVAPPSRDPTYYIIPLHGDVGETYTADLLDKSLADAARRKPTVVVLDINSPGGAVSEAEKMVKTLHRYNKDLRIVALVDQDLSASAITSLSVRTIYMKSSGTFGAATAFEDNPFMGPMDIQEKFQSAWRAVARNSAEEGGHEPLLAEAMIDNTVELHLETLDGKKVVKEGPGDVMLVKKGKILTLTSHEAVNCGLAAGLADDFDELGAALNFKGWKECPGLGTALADYLPKRRAAYEQKSKELQEQFRTNISAAEGAAPTEGMATNHILMGPGSPDGPRIIMQQVPNASPEQKAQWKSRSLTAVTALQKAEQNIQDVISLASAFGQSGLSEELGAVQPAIAAARTRIYQDRNKYANESQDTSPLVTGPARPPQVGPGTGVAASQGGSSTPAIRTTPGSVPGSSTQTASTTPAIRSTPGASTLPSRPQPSTVAPNAMALNLSNAPLPAKFSSALKTALDKKNYSVGKMPIPPSPQNPADEDIATDGGLLIGLRCGVGTFAGKDTLAYVQPIFLTAKGVVLGPGRGRPVNKATYDLVARNGYAVGGAIVSARPYVDGFRLHFVRIGEGRLDPSDGYDSPTIGQLDDSQAAGSMMPVVGIVTRAPGSSLHLGLLTLTPEVKPMPAVPLRGAMPPLAPSFTSLSRDALANKTYPQSKYLNNGQKPDFEDFAPDGGLLAGLRFGRKVLPAGMAVTVSVQPVFWTSKGQVLGAIHGDPSVAPAEELKAPPGYAVAACMWGGSTFLEYAELTYMKVGDKVLLPDDAYRSNRMGANRPDNVDVSTTFNGDGTPVIGLSGTYQTNRLKVGLIYLSPTDAATATIKTSGPRSPATGPTTRNN